MVVVYCPLCGKELRFKIDIDDYGAVSIGDYPDDRGDCQCTYHDDGDRDIGDAVSNVALHRFVEQLRTLIESQEFR